jgi:hypothetical protein
MRAKIPDRMDCSQKLCMDGLVYEFRIKLRIGDRQKYGSSAAGQLLSIGIENEANAKRSRVPEWRTFQADGIY